MKEKELLYELYMRLSITNVYLGVLRMRFEHQLSSLELDQIVEVQSENGRIIRLHAALDDQLPIQRLWEAIFNQMSQQIQEKKQNETNASNEKR